MKLLSLRRAIVTISAVGLTASVTGAGAAAAEGTQNTKASIAPSADGKSGSLHQVGTVKFP